MSSFIPMVSSSPPPMDDGGGFGWDDDDDDEFGTFASANTSYKEVEHDTSTGWDKSIGNQQNDTKDEFADFSAFDSKTISKNMIPSNDFSNVNEKGYQNNSSGDVNHYKGEINDIDVHVSSKDQEPGAPLTDSGMYSAEISPVQDIEKQGTSQKGCEHSDSLDDVQTDSLSENADQTFDSKYRENDMGTDKMANDVRHYKGTNGNGGVESDDSVIIKNISSENTLSKESHMCSESTVSTDKIIPDSNSNHSTQSADNFKSGLDSGSNKMAENKDTNVINSDSNESGCEITEIKLRLESGAMNTSDSKFGKFDEQDSVKDAHDQEKDENVVDEEKVKKFIDNEVISQALRKLSQDDDEENEQLDNSSIANLSYQKHISEDSATTADVQGSHSNDNRQNSLSGLQNHEKSLNLTDPNQTDRSVEVNDKTLTRDIVVSDSLQTGSNDSTFTNSEKTDSAEDKNSHNCHSSSQNSSPESSENLKGVNNSADKLDEKCDIESAKTISGDIEVSVNNGKENDEIEFCDDDFGDCSANQSSQDLSFRQPSIPYNDSDTPLSQKENSADDEVNDSDRAQSGLNKDQGILEDEGSDKLLKQTNSFSISDSAKNDPVTDDDEFGDFSVNQSNQDINDVNTEKHSNKTPDNVNDQIDNDDDDDDFGDFGDFSSGTTVVASDSVTKDDSFANFASESTETQDESWAAFDEPQPSGEDKDVIYDADDDDDWGAFGDEETSSEPPVQTSDTHQLQNAALQNMSKHEKLVYAVTSCFLENVESKFDKQVEDLSKSEKDYNPKSPPDVWIQIKSLQTSREVSYQWSKSEWNSQLFTTLHIDTRNVLIGHKKAQVPIFAAGLTLLEPVKGSSDGVLKPEVLVDTTKPDSTISQTQEAIPPAQFDWTSSGLTNPLEANNKTLNLDFLIQDQSTKSSELESEFLKPDPPIAQKPSIQPLENILASLKTNSTYRPQTRDENISTEAQKVVQSLPNLSFMKSRVLMFPIHMDDKN